MDYKDSWETIKEIGAGGQATVFEVVRKTEMIAYESEIISSLTSLTAIATQEKRHEHLRRFKSNFAKLLVLDKPQNHRALKVLHSPSEARDSNLAKQRIEKEISIMAEDLHPNLPDLLFQ